MKIFSFMTTMGKVFVKRMSHDINVTWYGIRNTIFLHLITINK